MEENQIAQNRIALIGILVQESSAVESVNSVLHEFAPYIVGRMGLPLRDRGINAISIVVDASTNVINALTGKLGAVAGISAKALFQKVQ